MDNIAESIEYHVLFISDHRLLCDAIGNTLKSAKVVTDFEIIRCGMEKSHLRTTDIEPNLLVLDACCFEDDGLVAVLEKLVAELPDTRIAVISESAVPKLVTSCIEAGSDGFLLKSEPLEDFIATIKELKVGRTRCCKEVAEAVLTKIRLLASTKKSAAHEVGSELTARELEVIQLVETGMQNKEIATRLGVRLSTIKNHLSSIYQKLKVSNRREAISQAIALGIVTCSAEPITV